MRDLVLEVVLSVLMAGLGLAVVWLFIGDRAREFNLDLAYIIGCFVFSVPAIILYERRKKRGY